MNRVAFISRDHAIVINRVTAFAAVSMTLGTYFWQPVSTVHYIGDVFLRTYLQFVAGVMAHECVHGHLGNSSLSNRWWGRFTMLPMLVPYPIFRKEHLQHHAATNIPGQDPDEFMNARRSWEIPLRAIALPIHWALWLHNNGRLTRRDRIENRVSLLTGVLVYAVVGYFAGIQRVVLGFIPVALLHSVFLWYTFAAKTHEGYSTGAPESRSHNYHSRLFYWFSFGLSLHRTHHLNPQLAWVQMAREFHLYHVPIELRDNFLLSKIRAETHSLIKCSPPK